jgi:hypothetical protein
VDRRIMLWTLVAFFGASVAFNLVQQATEDQPTAVTLAIEVVVLAAIVGVIVVLVRRSDRGDG